MPARLLVLSLVPAAVGAGPAACLAATGECLSQPPALLQTRQALGLAAAEDAAPGVPALVPAFQPPSDAEMARRVAGKKVPNAALQETVSASAAATYSARAYENYEQLKELRKQGFTCPGGKSFPPNSADLQFDCRLWKAAQLHSEDMGAKGYFSHVSPDGTDPFDRSSAQGLGTFSENIAAGESDAGKTLEQWKNSDGHCTNMMDAKHTLMAVGYANVGSSTHKHYWTSLFASGGSADTSCYP